jgi:DNA helicase-2/ATP-dependent DNA helicase PcrA
MAGEAESRPSISERALARAGAPYLEGLNPEQRSVVESTEGAVLVLAGAGTGKTRALTTRIAHILATGRAWPSQILAVTFTNKAAREIKERIGHLVGGAVEGMPWLGTFHSIGVKILRRHAELVGLKNGFTILDTDDQLRLMKQVIEAAGIDKDRWPARQLANLIDSWKNRGITPADVAAGESFAFANGKGAELYAQYQQRLKDLNAVDFGDLLMECLRLFREHPDVLADYHRRFKYILVDEYQDTNVVQYLWLKLLAQGSPNICCVGDDDQCVAADTPVTMPDRTTRPISSLEAGDQVLSCYGSGDFRAAKVLRVHRKETKRQGVRITLASGEQLTSTAEHVHFAGYRLGMTPQTHFVYLMHKRNVGYRIGTSQVYTAGQVRPGVGFLLRSRQEHADATWIISTHADESAARFEEARLSLTYGLPTLPFVPRRSRSRRGLVHDGDAISRLFASLNTEEAGERLLFDHGLDRAAPHHTPRSRNSARRNVVVTLCGDRRGHTPMHRLSIVGNDAAGAEALTSLGFSVRPAKAGSTSWRVETAKARWSEIMADVRRMEQAFPVTIIRQARFGDDNTQPADKAQRAANALPFVRAAAIRPGMVMFTASGYGVVDSVEPVELTAPVVDIDVEATHNFIAAGIVTHNSIYGWRGAEVGNILRFEQDFPGAKVIRLERNYRSKGHILAAASGLIAKNKSRLGKTLFTDDDLGAKLTVTGVWDDEEEARIIGEDIEAARKQGQRLNEVAILVRASAQMRAIEDRFITLGLPYRVIGGPRFYERQEIKDAVAYLEVVANPANDLKFERIVNTPKRGLGDTTVKRVHELARTRSIPMTSAAQLMVESDELGGKARKSMYDLLRQIERWRSQVATMKHTDLAGLILDESGYTAMWQADKSPQSQSRLDNLKELVRFMDQFDTLAGFLEHVSLVMDADQADDGDRVSLMTLHAAKGLEFDTVFLPGWEEGLFPHQRALDESGLDGLEEERRLAYVGVTRARRSARVSFAQNRRMRGMYQSAVPSRFVDELPEAHVDVVEAKSPFGGAYASFGSNGGFGRPNPYGKSRFDERQTPYQQSTYQTPGWQRARQQWKTHAQAEAVKKKAPVTLEGELVASSTGGGAYAVGDRITHQKFGPGTVTLVDGNKLTIQFDSGETKRVVDSFVDRQ